jgi:ABC-type transport system involved in multi-copper enzyme maturation permease subunit
MTAVTVKEWRRLLRMPGTPWALMGYVLLPVLVAAVYLKALGSAAGVMPQMMPMIGAQSLATLATWQLLLLAAIAPWVSAGLVADEVEERTLDPLLAGGRSLIGVLAAKLLAAVLFLALFVMAGLPVYAVPFTVGGVTWAMLGRVVALQLATLVMMAAIGLALSAWGRKAGGVALAGVALGLLLTLGTGLATDAMRSGPANVYGNQMIMKGGGMMMVPPGAQPQPGQLQPEQVGERLPKWLYGNPLVGLNSALSSGPGLGLGLPGSGSAPVYKTYLLWQVQLAGGPGVAVVGLLAAWLGLWARMRWRRPAWLYRQGSRKLKGVAADAAH